MAIKEKKFAMKSSGYALSMLLVILMLSSVVSAQQTVTQSTPIVPRLVNFSGKAADSRGKSISGIAGLAFAIYKDQYEGTRRHSAVAGNPKRNSRQQGQLHGSARSNQAPRIATGLIQFR
jgi:hypothetical protein